MSCKSVANAWHVDGPSEGSAGRIDTSRTNGKEMNTCSRAVAKSYEVLDLPRFGGGAALVVDDWGSNWRTQD